jgi:hypothetical protein
MLLLANAVTKQGDRVGARTVKSITPLSAEKLYKRVIDGPNGLRLRQGEKLVVLCRRAWSVVQRLHPDAFNRDVPNPWTGVTMKRRTRKIKATVDRDIVYEFAWKAIEAGYPEPAAAAVICFEWLQRPENVLAGCITWTDDRGPKAPTAIKVEHHKTGATVWHPLEEKAADGLVTFYSEAEAVLSGTERIAPTRVTPKPPWSAHWPRPGSVTRTGSRTNRAHPFRMRAETRFRMTPATIAPLLRNSLWSLN